MAEQFDNEWGNSKQTSLRQVRQRWSVHQPHKCWCSLGSNQSLTCRRGLAEYRGSHKVRYAGWIPADEPLVLIRRTFGLFRGTPQRYPVVAYVFKDPRRAALGGPQ